MNTDLSNVCSALRRIVLLPSVCLVAGLFGCSNSSHPNAAPQANAPAEKAAHTDSLLEEAVFTKSLKGSEPEKPCTSFEQSETIYLSLKFKGRPSKGVTTAKFYCEGDFLTDAKVDMADVNSGVLVSVGECTYVNFTLKHEKPFPVSDKYRVETFLDGKPLGTYNYSVVAPAEKVSEAEAPSKM